MPSDEIADVEIRDLAESPIAIRMPRRVLDAAVLDEERQMPFPFLAWLWRQPMMSPVRVKLERPRCASS